MNYQFKYRALAKILYEALVDDAFYRSLERSVSGEASTKQEAMLMYMDYSMIEAETYGELFIPDTHMHGVSVWSKPIDIRTESERKISKNSFILVNMGQDSFDTYAEIIEFMSLKASEIIPPDAWYLSIVGLKPGFQGQGLGSTLINPVLEKTDSVNISTYLETFTLRNMSFYERLGYKSIASIHEPTVDANYWIMKRDPN